MAKDLTRINRQATSGSTTCLATRRRPAPQGAVIVWHQRSCSMAASGILPCQDARDLPLFGIFGEDPSFSVNGLQFGGVISCVSLCHAWQVQGCCTCLVNTSWSQHSTLWSLQLHVCNLTQTYWPTATYLSMWTSVMEQYFTLKAYTTIQYMI